MLRASGESRGGIAHPLKCRKESCIDDGNTRVFQIGVGSGERWMVLRIVFVFPNQQGMEEGVQKEDCSSTCSEEYSDADGMGFLEGIPEEQRVV